MKKFLSMVFLMGLSLAFSSAQARDTKLILPIADAMNSPKAKEVLNPNIKVRFASGSGRVIRSGLVTNKKTNALGKSDEAACQWVFLSAVKQFQETAAKNNARKVINLISYYKKNPYRSRTHYECHVGAVIAGVALKGDIAR